MTALGWRGRRSSASRTRPLTGRAVLAASAALGLCMLAAGALAGAQAQTTPSVTVTAGDGALTVQWAAPTPGAGITSYDLRYIKTSSDETVDANWTEVTGVWQSGPLQYLLTGLDNGTGYDVQVRAVTAGNGGWSSTAAATPADHGATRTAATSLSLEVPAGGNISSGSDVDYFRFTVSGTKRILAYTTGSTKTEVTLQDASRDLHVGEDAFYVAGAGNELVWDALSAGTYYLQVSGSGDASGDYVLRTVDVGVANTTFATAVDVEVGSATHGIFDADAAASSLPAYYYRLVLTEQTDLIIRTSGLAPDTVGATFDADEELTHRNDDSHTGHFLILATLEAGTHYIRARPYSSDGVGPYLLHVDEAVAAGSSTSTAASMALGDVVAATFDTPGEVDYFRLDLDRTVQVEAVGLNTGVNAAAGLRGTLLDSSASSVGANFQDGDFYLSPYVGFSALRTLTAGTYYLRVETEGWSAGADEPDSVRYAVGLTEPAEYRDLVRTCARDVTGVLDPLYGCQWHLDNIGGRGGTADEDINIGDVWQTTTGTGVNIAVVDSGVDNLHEDLGGRFDSSASHDYTGSGSHSSAVAWHGTRVAGIISAEHNFAGVRGVAPGARIRSFNLLTRNTFANKADAMTRQRASTAVSNNSWGPSDNGWPQRAPRLWERAIDKGLDEGHGGLGTVYVFAGGNGGPDDDSGLDEYANYYGVTAVCAVNSGGVPAYYSEPGSNLWVCAPSGDGLTASITTTNVGGGYISDFAGTSAAAPQVAGVAALVRSANPALTWRDVKLILAGSARKNDPADSGWATGASKYGSAGDNYEFNRYYGFGVVDADAAVTLAQSWTNVPEMLTRTAIYSGPTRRVQELRAVTSPLSLGPGVEFVEYVEVNVLMSANFIRELRIELVSPSGTVSELVHPDRASHALLRASEGYLRLGSARHLGEDAEGEWRLRITDVVSGVNAVSLDSWILTVYGHASKPGPPAIISVVGGTADLAVTWEAPALEGASSITSYDVRHIRSDATDRSDSTVADDVWSSGALTYTITSLAAGVNDFDVQVRAVNSFGDGLWSTAVRASRSSTANAPRFGSSETGVRSIAENTPTGTTIGTPIAATDADTDPLTYSTAGVDAGAFDVDAATGQLRARGALNHEIQDQYEFTLAVTDPSGLSDEIDVTVNVTDVDEPVRLFGGSKPQHREFLDTRVGGYIAIDPEGAEVVWSLSGPDAAHFTLVDGDPDSFLATFLGPNFVYLEFAQDPDYEAWADTDGDNVFEVTVEATAGPTTTLDVEVTVTDVDERPEVFGEDSVEFTEGSSGEVASFGARDPEGLATTWLNLGGPDWNLFSLDGGILRFRSPPDFENARDAGTDNTYEVTVSAAAALVRASKDVVVTVTDIDEAGSMLLSPPQGSVGTALTARFSDPDGVVSGSLTWRWERSPDGNSWSAISGANTATYTPDSNDQGKRLRVVASYSDGEGSGKSAEADAGTVSAAVPSNYNARFALAATGREVAENTAARTAFGAAVAAVDHDRDALTYSLGGTDAASFTIVSSTGQIRASAALDYEQKSSYSLEVSVRDGKAADGSADTATDDTVAVTVTVSDVDEAPAVDEIDPGDFEENGSGEVARFSGSDPEGRNLAFTLGGTDASVFRMTLEGALKFISPPDYDKPGDGNGDNAYQLVVRASDGPNTASREVTVTVTDVNEDPELSVTASGPFAENGTGTAVALRAADPEKGEMTWSLSGSDRAALSITGSRSEPGISTAGISFIAPPDFEAEAASSGDNLYRVTATVSDGTNAVSEELTVWVTDVDEAPTITGETDVTYDENRTDALGSYTGSDPEGQTVTWSLSGTDAGAFEVSDAGELSFRASHIVDFENPGDRNGRNDYSVTVRTSDGDNTGELDVVVDVGNVDETGAISLSSQQPQEGVALTAAVSDPDGSVSGQQWKWEKSPNGSSNWTVITGASTGSYIPESADVGEHLRMSATYRDGHGPNKPASAQPSEAVRAAPPMNQAPQFPGTETGQRSVAENEPEGTGVGSPVTAVDGDTGDTLTYSLRGTQAADFSIDSVSGQVSTRRPLDREERRSYTFTVRATDASRAFDDVSVRVTVSDVDEVPVLEGPTRVSYAETRTDTVAVYEAADPEGLTIRWSMEGGPDRAHFSIDDGNLKFRSPPDFEQPFGGSNTYSVTVVASDGSESARRGVEVVVTRVDEPPEIRGLRSIEHPENNAVVGIYTATDPEGETVEWSLGGSDGDSFALGGDGTLRFKLAPDYEQRGDADRDNVYNVSLTASDGGRAAEATVRVRVVNADDLGSVVLSPEQPVVGATVTARLSDPDGGVRDAEWTWEHSPDNQDWEEIDARTSRYVPSTADLDRYLRATVNYTDREGSGKVARGLAPRPVTDAPVGPGGPSGPGPGGPSGPGPGGPSGPGPGGPSGPGPGGPSGPGPGGGGGGGAPETVATGFVDVDPDGVHAANIDALAAANITLGCATEPRRFCPNRPVTRAQMATFLTRALNLDPAAATGFVDVDPDGVHAANIDALAAANITLGCATEPRRFCPNRPVTRAQMATFLTRALNLDPAAATGFVDVDPDGVHAANIDALAAANITLGCATEPRRFCPNRPVTRAQMATFLTRALNLAQR